MFDTLQSVCSYTPTAFLNLGTRHDKDVAFLSLQLAMKWIDFNASRQVHAAELLSHVRFETIPASELVSQIQPVPRMMMDPQCHRLLVDAMNYHLLPYQQNTLQSRRTQVRSGQQTLLTVGGRPSLTERALSREVGALLAPLCVH